MTIVQDRVDNGLKPARPSLEIYTLRVFIRFFFGQKNGRLEGFLIKEKYVEIKMFVFSEF